MYRRKLEKVRYVADWQETYSIVKKNRNFYSENDIEKELFQKLNAKDRKSVGVNIWTHGESAQVVKQLKDSGKVEADNFFWKGNLRIKKVKKLQNENFKMS